MSQSENDEILGNIIQSNHYIRHRVQKGVNDFLLMRKNLLSQLQTKKLNDISKEFAPLIDAMSIETLNQQITSNKVQLALCGENSSGKTSFIHLLLGIGNILPADVGPITARIVKMRYAEPEDACAHIYPSIEESLNKKNGIKVDLSSFFIVNDADDEPNWEGIADKLGEYVRRPLGIDIKSKEFAIWAKHFIEIRLPSPTLKLGIDVYDTAGFRIRDAQVLKDCLYDLVRLVHPTIVFLYDTPTSTEETNDCFLALKDVLKHFDSSNIFFLNTKADIDKLPDIKKIKTEEQFINLLNNERIIRYNLLLKTPGMVNSMIGGLPKTFDKCNCFDICSANSEWMVPLGPIINKIAIQRLIQFVANSDLIMAQRVCNLVLPGIEAFFDLALITSHRERGQLEQLRSDAQQWIEIYFQEHRQAFKKFLRDIFQKILDRLLMIKNDLINRASKQNDISSMKLFIQLAIEQEVMKGIVYDALGTMSKTALDLMSSNQNLMINAASNEILVSALRIDTTDRIDTINDESKNAAILRYFMMQTITAPALMVTDHLFSDDMNQAQNNLLPSVNDHQQENDLNEIKNVDPLQVANKYLSEVQVQINAAENMFNTTVGTWCARQKAKLKKQISQQYEAAIAILPVRRQTHEILQKFTNQFIRIECQLQAAQDLAKFNGKKPIIHRTSSSSSSTITTGYRIDAIEWGSIKKNLFVKRLTRSISGHPDTSYLEAHYHRKMNNLNIPNIIKLTYLYENELPDHSYELWMIFQTESLDINRTLKHFIQQHNEQKTFISLKQIIEIMISIINSLVGLHENELVHRNMKSTNILLDEENRSFLADLGDWNLSNNDQSIDTELRHHITGGQDGINDDIKGFGQIGFKLLSILDIQEITSSICSEFKQLMGSCLEPELRAPEIRERLKYFYQKLKFS